MKTDVFLEVAFNIHDGTFTIETNMNVSGQIELLENWLRSQLGAGLDGKEAEDHIIYNIRLECALETDTLYITKDNTGSKSLRDGILLQVMRSLQSTSV